MKMEQYTFVLKHEFVDGENSFPLEEPIVFRMVYDRSQGCQPILMNEMLERFKQAILASMQRGN